MGSQRLPVRSRRVNAAGNSYFLSPYRTKELLSYRTLRVLVRNKQGAMSAMSAFRIFLVSWQPRPVTRHTPILCTSIDAPWVGNTGRGRFRLVVQRTTWL